MKARRYVSASSPLCHVEMLPSYKKYILRADYLSSSSLHGVPTTAGIALPFLHGGGHNSELFPLGVEFCLLLYTVWSLALKIGAYKGDYLVRAE